MLKGHATIELTNVKTGEIEKYEEDNLITNAALEQLNNEWTLNLGGVSTVNSWFLPLSSKMGGITLFEELIEENPEITYFPENNRIVGFAGSIADTGKNDYWGSRNIAESENYDPDTKRIKYVWDFKTNQAIGAISSVGLTYYDQNNYFGDSLWCRTYGRYLNATSYFSDLGRNIVEMDGTTCTTIKTQPNSNIATIEKYNFDFTKIGANESAGHKDLIFSTQVTLPYSYAYNNYIWKDGGDAWYGFIITENGHYNSQYYYYSEQYFNLGNERSRYGGQHLQIYKINKNTFELEYHNVSVPSYYVCPMNNLLITKNYIILPISSSSRFADTNSRSNTSNLQKYQYDKAAFIDLKEWTCSIKNFMDSEGKAYSLLKNTNTNYNLEFIYSSGLHIARLPNGTYMFNNLILDDDGQVIKNTFGPINTSTGVPMYSSSDFSNTYYATSITPYNGGYYLSPSGNATYHIIPNKKSGIYLWVGTNSNSSGEVHTHIIPLYSQKLMTINNLETPIEKTSDKTMKITYILTEVEDEE